MNSGSRTKMTQDGRCRVYHKTDAKCLDHDDSSTQTHKMYTDVPSHVRIITKNVVYSYILRISNLRSMSRSPVPQQTRPPQEARGRVPASLIKGWLKLSWTKKIEIFKKSRTKIPTKNRENSRSALQGTPLSEIWGPWGVHRGVKKWGFFGIFDHPETSMDHQN